MSNIEPGAIAPDFELAGPDGPIKFADFAGKPLVLYFYPKDDTTGCTKEAQEFSALATEFAKASVTVVGVSKDSVKTHAKFTAKYDLKLPLGSDPEGTVIAAYGSWIEKSMYGRQYMGIDRSTFLIDGSGKVASVWRKVRVSGHAAEVLAAAKLL